MILVRHVMTDAPKTLSPERTVADAAGLMHQYDVGVIPLAGDDGMLVGLVTDRDLVVRVLAKRRDPREVSLGEIATSNVVTVSPDASVTQARDLMSEHRIRRLPVVKEGRLVGIVALGDIAVAGASTRAAGQVLEEVSESPSTSSYNDGPTRGTPERVRRNRGTGGGEGSVPRAS
jgi:CBS domain-containing protein